MAVKYVLLPPDQTAETAAASIHSPRVKPGRRLRPSVRVLDTIGGSAASLVELNARQRERLLAENPGMRIARVVHLHPLWLRRKMSEPPSVAAALTVTTNIEVLVKDRVTGAPISGVFIQAVRDFARSFGQENRTNAAGKALFKFKSSIERLEFLAIEPDRGGYWPRYLAPFPISGTSANVTVELDPIDVSALADGRVHFHGSGSAADGAGVKVAIIDSGVTPGPDLTVAGGANLVAGENPDEFTDSGLGHGTHVAGIVAAKGRINGIAPGCELRAYRVFAKGAPTAESFTIAKAIRRAVDDGCDLINLSLGVDQDVPEIQREVRRARTLGAVCIAAAGNDFRKEIAFPAKYEAVMAVTAAGRKGTYPPGSVSPRVEVAPFGAPDPENYSAGFSNTGEEADAAGAGVAIVSTFPGGFAVLSGTSMAAPAITGAIARMLGADAVLLAQPRDQNRAEAIVRKGLAAAKALGFGVQFEGAGLIR